jgi:hypothetical protein
MKKLIVIAISLAALAAAETAKGKAPAKAAAKAKALPAGLPKDAVSTEPGLWKHTDAKGQVWMYRQTPFGFSRYKPEDVAPVEDISEAALLQAVEDGDSVKFEKKTPFGTARWTKKKSELNGPETIAWKRAAAKGKE